jgi:hypothetical protein
MYQNIREILGKHNLPLTQIEIDSPASLSNSPFSTLSSKSEIEENILQCNRRHSLQALHTLFMQKSQSNSSINPDQPALMDQLLDNTFLDSLTDTSSLTDSEKLWISSLKKIVTQKILLTFSLDDFKHFFLKNKNSPLYLRRDGTSAITKQCLSVSDKTNL